MNIFVPLCGLGTRFASAAAPKPFVNVGPKVLLRYAVDTLHLQPDDHVWIFGRPSMCHLFDKHKWPANVTWLSVAETTRGAADTVSRGLQMCPCDVSKACVVIDGDSFYTEDVLSLVRHCTTPTLVVFEVENEPPIYSYAALQGEDAVTQVAEKDPISKWANSGAYAFPRTDVLNTACLDVLASGETGLQRGEFYMSSVFRHLLSVNTPIRACKISKHVHVNLGTPDAVALFLKTHQAALFDLDGTLVNTDQMYFEVWSEMLRRVDVTLTPELYNTYVRSQSDAHVLRTLFPTHSKVTLTQEKHNLVKRFLPLVTSVPGAAAFCKLLQRRGDAVIIVTNNNRECAELLLACHAIPYDAIIIGGECARPKPYPDPYETASQLATAAECVVFEDSPVGILSAQTAGLGRIVGMATSLSKAELTGLGCVAAWTSFEEATDLIPFCDVDNNRLQADIAFSLRVDPRSVTVETVRIKGGFIADVCGVTVDNARYVLKMKTPRPTTMLHRMAETLKLHHREFHFYETVARYVPVSTPMCKAVVRDAKTHETIGVLLERLEDNSHWFNVNVNKQPVDVSLSVIRHIAALHAWSWNKQADAQFGLLRHNDVAFTPSWSRFIQERWPLFEQRWSTALPRAHMKVLRRIATLFERVQHAVSIEPLCICHGDVKAPNLVFLRSNMTPVFLDWQYTIYGKGAGDVLFYCIESFEPAHFMRWKRLLLEYYWVQLTAHGVQNYTRAQFEQDTLAALCHFPFFVAVWFGTTPTSDLIDVNFPFFFIQRYSSALEESFDALTAFLDSLSS